MKLTRTQLNQIIKEELQNALNEEGIPPMDMGLPNDVGTPEKLLDALELFISRGDIQGRYADDIISLINKQLKKSSESPQYVVDELQRIKDNLIYQYMPLLAKDRERRSARRDQYRSGADQAESSPSRMTTLQSLGIGESAKMKLTRTQLNQIIKEEISSTIQAKRIVDFLKDHGDVGAELSHKDDGGLEIMVTTKVFDTVTGEMETEVHYIEPTMSAAREILEY